jgi:hypothetical protein
VPKRGRGGVFSPPPLRGELSKLTATAIQGTYSGKRASSLPKRGGGTKGVWGDFPGMLCSSSSFYNENEKILWGYPTFFKKSSFFINLFHLPNIFRKSYASSASSVILSQFLHKQNHTKEAVNVFKTK